MIALSEVKGVLPSADPHGHGDHGHATHDHDAHVEKEVAHVHA